MVNFYTLHPDLVELQKAQWRISYQFMFSAVVSSDELFVLNVILANFVSNNKKNIVEILNRNLSEQI